MIMVLVNGPDLKRDISGLMVVMVLFTDQSHQDITSPLTV